MAESHLCLKRRKQKRVPSKDETLSRITDDGSHKSRQVAKCPANLVHGVVGTGFTINGR